MRKYHENSYIQTPSNADEEQRHADRAVDEDEEDDQATTDDEKCSTLVRELNRIDKGQKLTTDQRKLDKNL